jgi:N-acetylmuramoyl-L-alanine amidase
MAAGGSLARVELESGDSIVLRDGRSIFLECSPPAGDAAKAFLDQYLADKDGWKKYKDRMAVAVPFSELNGATRRATLEKLFSEDTVDSAGWWHTVKYAGDEGQETWWNLAEWFTGVGTRYKELRADSHNTALGDTLTKGQKLLIPAKLMPEEMRASKAEENAPLEPVSVETSDENAPVKENGGDLEYGKDAQGAYAAYTLKTGETLYSSVVGRFTDFKEHQDMVKACETIEKRSGLPITWKVDPGTRVRVPVEMLSDRYQPKGSVARSDYETVRQEAKKLQVDKVRTTNLDGVVVILDPGHGGRDQGASISRAGLYEGRLNYDMACRAKKTLESKTKAKVYMTMKDVRRGFEPSEDKRFSPDNQAQVQTSPPYPNEESKTSANLRSYLANDIFRRETEAGVNERKIVYISIHCDSEFKGKMRGAMIYIPGAKFRPDEETPGGPDYDKYREVREHRTIITTETQRRKDEALSNNFALTLVDAFTKSKPPIKLSTGLPIRNVIRQRGDRTYVPAVLRHTLVPTKVLIEVANLTNLIDQQRLGDPKWRQSFADALVAGLQQYYGN